MSKTIKVHPKKRRCRPATGKDPLVSARLTQDLIDQIEQWASVNAASRSEAIRRLVELGLTVKTAKAKQAPKLRADRAKELAGHAIDQMSDETAHPDERASRGRRLTKGPEEFRDVRVDRPKK